MARYLRRKGAMEHEIFAHTDGLFARGDMVEVEEGEALRILQPKLVTETVPVPIPIAEPDKPVIADEPEPEKEEVVVKAVAVEPAPAAKKSTPKPRKPLKSRAKKIVAKPVKKVANDDSAGSVK